MTDQEKADEREGEELTQAIRRRLEDISRYNFLTNAGGVVATLSFIGTTWGRDDGPGKYALIPLGLFLLGLCLCGFALNARLLLVLRHGFDLAKQAEPDKEFKLPSSFEKALQSAQGAFLLGANASTILFFIGCFSGFLLLALR
ncbi:MAG: hypothetical protein LCH56_16440 [Proteobacteria bacterium]|nr:hypothetical protein [Pseudomonadota bacterium]